MIKKEEIYEAIKDLGKKAVNWDRLSFKTL